MVSERGNIELFDSAVWPYIFNIFNVKRFLVFADQVNGFFSFGTKAVSGVCCHADRVAFGSRILFRRGFTIDLETLASTKV